MEKNWTKIHTNHKMCPPRFEKIYAYLSKVWSPQLPNFSQKTRKLLSFFLSNIIMASVSVSSQPLSVAENFFSKQFYDFYKDGRFNRDELVNMAGLRSKVPSLEALANIIDLARHPVMCFDLKEEIRLQGTISTVSHAMVQIEKDYEQYEELMQEKRHNMLCQMAEQNKDDPQYCPSVHSHFIGHNVMTCVHCKSRVFKFVRGPRGGSRRGEITDADFLQDYYTRYDVIQMLQTLRQCQCCVRHQAKMVGYRRVVPFEKPFRSFLDFASEEEIEMITGYNMYDGDVLPSFKVYPNTHAQSKLPCCWHKECNCKCVNAISQLVCCMEELEMFRSHTSDFEKWGSFVHYDDEEQEHVYDFYDPDFDCPLWD